MIYSYKKITKCRLCDAKIKKIISFGNLPLGNNFTKTLKESLKQKKYPLGLMRCINCNHFQLGVSVNPKLLYATNYTYLSGVGSTFIKHFREYVDWSIKEINLKKSDLVVDIGSNDGTCLSFFKRKKITVCGVDPAKKPSKIANANNIFTINNFFNKRIVNKIIKKFGKAKFITSHNVLAHISDIKTVFKDIFHLLDDDGYFCFEIGYFRSVLENNLFDTIYHEHLDYHHASPLVSFLNMNGFSVIKITKNDIQGGSIRILSKKSLGNSKNSLQVLNFCRKEKKSILFNNKKINKFVKEIDLNSKKIENLFNKLNDKKIIGFGAPTKATLLNKTFKINSETIGLTFEDNVLKQDKYLPCSEVKIISSNLVNEIIFDYIFIYAWNFSDDIIKKLRKYISKSKKKKYAIIPLPKLKIIKI